MNCVDITGRVREALDETYRKFEYELPYFDDPSRAKTFIVVKFWNNTPNARLITLEENTRVLIHGHLDSHEKFGTILIVEQLETLH